jgi:superfamily I DNA/RNA helicase
MLTGREQRVNDVSIAVHPDTSPGKARMRRPRHPWSVDLHPSVVERLARLAPDQRAAATAAPGPSLCIAPAGSGKTTTLVARAAWLIATGTPPEAIRAITFNKRAAVEMTERLDTAIAPLGVAPGTVRVRTFHALGREILRDAGVPVDPLVDRAVLLRQVAPWADDAGLLRLDTIISRLKVELSVAAADVAADPEAGPVARAFVAYQAAVQATGGLDFDDLILRAIHELERSTVLLERWRARCRELLVDEVQDVDRAQLRLALLLAAPANRIFLVGDDDQSIYGWRLADVRRILSLAEHLPGLRRVDLEVNYRCPRPVVERAVRLVERNGERFAKRITAGPGASGSLVLAPDTSDETVRLARAVATWPDDGSTRAILARTNRELLPAVAVALELGLPFRAPRIELLLDSPLLDVVMRRATVMASQGEHPLVTLGRVRRAIRRDRQASPGESELATALLAWAVGFADLGTFSRAVDHARKRLAALRRDDAPLTLATAHATKGLEFDHVIVVGMETGRFPSARTVAEAEDPIRAFEEERRLAYVAWTRARRTLTILFDPTVPSPFLLEAFSPVELGLEGMLPG